jgi:hypothetical protein
MVLNPQHKLLGISAPLRRRQHEELLGAAWSSENDLTVDEHTIAITES